MTVPDIPFALLEPGGAQGLLHTGHERRDHPEGQVGAIRVVGRSLDVGVCARDAAILQRRRAADDVVQSIDADGVASGQPNGDKVVPRSGSGRGRIDRHGIDGADAVLLDVKDVDVADHVEVCVGDLVVAVAVQQPAAKGRRDQRDGVAASIGRIDRSQNAVIVALEVRIAGVGGLVLHLGNHARNPVINGDVASALGDAAGKFGRRDGNHDRQRSHDHLVNLVGLALEIRAAVRLVVAGNAADFNLQRMTVLLESDFLCRGLGEQRITGHVQVLRNLDIGVYFLKHPCSLLGCGSKVLLSHDVPLMCRAYPLRLWVFGHCLASRF